MRRWAIMSPGGPYRYRLGRQWGPGPIMAFVMLNPSTADAETDDPTVRRCIGFARREGCGGIEIGNLFAWRAAHPRDLPADRNLAVGPVNAIALATMIERVGGPIVAAWGSHPAAAGSGHDLAARYPAGRFRCLGRTASGAPRHPLYVRGDQPLEPF